MDDVPYEEEIQRNFYSVKSWLNYINSTKDCNKATIIYERALRQLPGSYTIWRKYLKFRCSQVQGKCVTNRCYEDVNNVFERSLVFMHKMPRIWIDYIEFLMMNQPYISKTRQVFDRAIRSLPITQHKRIWPYYLKFVREINITETAVRIYKRYLKLYPEDTEEFIQYLLQMDKIDEAAVELFKIINSDFVSKHGKSKHQLLNELCELVAKNPNKVHSLNFEAIVRDWICSFTNQIGHFWNLLAQYYLRQGLFDRARDIYEEALSTVMTVRDFTQVFDAYVASQEGLINAKIKEGTSEDDELDLRLAWFENLLERRPLLLNSVLLRQNPHDVQQWHRRVKLLEGKPEEVISTFSECLSKVDPRLASGKYHTLWVEFAKFYESHKKMDDARNVFEEAILQPYTDVDDLASVWCEFAEMEIRNEKYENALKVMKRAIAQDNLRKCLKVYLLLLDLEEYLGTFKSVTATYNRIIDLKIVTPQVILNYAKFLEDKNYVEEAFKIYEKGTSLFQWPNVADVWNTYLLKFIKKYGRTKIERSRDLFEHCLEKCPPKWAKSIYLLYGKMEEDYGSPRLAVTIYKRAAKQIKESRFELFNIYIRKAAEIHGILYTRQIYEQAIQVLPDAQASQMCLKFAELERKLGEIDRARAIYAHCSQMCDPRTNLKFWKTWEEFEIKHGNEDTMKEMLQIKRSVKVTLSQNRCQVLL